MDFFEYANIALNFVGEEVLYLPLIIGALCYLIVFAFQSVGLFIISGKEGYKHRWMSFVPVLNTYYIGVCGQKNRLFKSVDTKVFSLIAAILEAVFIICSVIFWVAVFVLFKNGYLIKIPDETIYGQTYYWALSSNKIPGELLWAGWCLEYMDNYVLSIVQLAFLVFEVFTLSAFFQTFAARRYMIFTITSVLFPVQGILIFILKNNKGMNYRDYMRKEQEKQYRMYQQYRRQQDFDQNPYNQNPYSRNNSYGPYDGFGGGVQNNSSAGGEAPGDPFSEFGGGNDDPFSN